jgi:hypothetical protein
LVVKNKVENKNQKRLREIEAFFYIFLKEVKDIGLLFKDSSYCFGLKRNLFEIQLQRKATLFSLVILKMIESSEKFS